MQQPVQAHNAQQQAPPLPPQQAMLQTVPQSMIPPVYTSPKGMWSTKLSLRIVSCIFCLVLVGITTSLLVSWSIYPLVCYVPPAGLGFIWSFSESICLCVRGGHRGIHPGANVALELVLWLGYLASTVTLGLMGFASRYDFYDDYYDYSYYGYYDNYDGGDVAFYIRLSRAAIAIGSIEILVHFALFVMACYETNVRNKQSPQIIYIPGPAYGMVMQPGTHESMIAPQNYQIPAGYMPQVYYPQQPQYYKPQDQATTQQSNLPESPTPVHQPTSVRSD